MVATSKQILAENLKRLRADAELSQRGLASIARKPQCEISKIERGIADVRLGTLDQLAKALKVRPSDLLHE